MAKLNAAYWLIVLLVGWGKCRFASAKLAHALAALANWETGCSHLLPRKLKMVLLATFTLPDEPQKVGSCALAEFLSSFLSYLIQSWDTITSAGWA